jgi:hypothetical protein
MAASNRVVTAQLFLIMMQPRVRLGGRTHARILRSLQRLGESALGPGFQAVVRPEGRRNGLDAFNVVAGLCNRRYLQLWSGAA